MFKTSSRHTRCYAAVSSLLCSLSFSPLFSLPVLAQHDTGQAATTELVYSQTETSGAAQSPINILSSLVEPGAHDIELHYQASQEHIVNTGHTIEADFDAGSYMEYDGQVYNLKQLHFHTPSEHQIDGLTYPLELHMVHTLASDPGKYLVIGVFFKDGAANDFIEDVLAHAPREAGAHYDGNMQISASEVVAAEQGYYHYEGSLTTPPYTETVTWLVMKDIHTADSAQIQALNVLEGNNARHIQNLHARHVEGE